MQPNHTLAMRPVEMLAPMAPDTLAGVLRARMEDGPATLAMLMAAVAEWCAQSGEVVPRGAAGLLAMLSVLSASGQVACVKALIARKRGSIERLVWCRAEDKPELLRKAAAHKERQERKRMTRALGLGGADKPKVVILSVAEAAPVGHGADEAPGPMEIISRLAGSTTYKEPGTTHGTRPGMTNDEIDFVLTLVEDRLGADMARSLACYSALSWPSVLRLGYPHLLEAMRADWQLRGLAAGDRRHRIQSVLQHVYHDLAAHRQRNKDEAAKQCGLRTQTYRRAYGFIESELHSLAHDAAQKAIDRLLGRDEWDK